MPGWPDFCSNFTVEGKHELFNGWRVVSATSCDYSIGIEKLDKMSLSMTDVKTFVPHFMTGTFLAPLITAYLFRLIFQR